MENLTGQSLKGYELLERIGTGGFGAVYRAYQSTIGREVAVKAILPHFVNQPEFIRRFEAEAQYIARLEHLHIVPLYDYWREPGGAYLVMRWLRGGSARDTLREGVFGLASAAALLDQVCAALNVAHSAGVVHRDLKPSNILLDEEGNAYLADFGIATDLRRANGGEWDSTQVPGSPAYLAPEQIRGEAIGPQTDVYSLGVTAYELLTGSHPYHGLNAVELLYKHINDRIPEIDAIAADVRADLNDVLQTATAKDPRYRYNNALAFAAAFRLAARLDEQEAAAQADLLTNREQEVLRLIASGMTNREIGQALYVEHGTVKWYIRQIYRKLDVRSRKQAVVKANSMELSGDGAGGLEMETASLDLSAPPLLNPYKGLRAFASADRDDFYGREELVGRLLEHLTVPPLEKQRVGTPSAGRFLAVVGPSGSGKSSLVAAGLVPALWGGQVPGSEQWFVVEMSPGYRPLEALEIALIRVAADQAENLREQLLRDRRGLLRAAELILPRDGSELVVVVDQFEELFQLVDDEQHRAYFLDLLTTAVTEPRSRLRVVLTLRADYYDRPLQYPEFGQLIRLHMETVLPLKVEELERAIIGPARAVGVTFEPGLVAAIIDDVLYRPGALPLLQYALTELFERRSGRTLTHHAYLEMGGATGALARRAEELYLEQDVRGRELVRQLFLRLVSTDRDEKAPPDARRRVPRSELEDLDPDEDLVDDILDVLTAYRLLTVSHDPANRRPTVEVAHEALLREWARVRDWLEDSRDDLRMGRQLVRAAEEWRQADEDPSFLLTGTRLLQFEAWSRATGLTLTPGERHFLQESALRREEQDSAEAARRAHERRLEVRTRRVLQALLGVLLAATLVTGWFAWESSRSFSRAESQRLAAEAINVLERGGSPELAALLALQGLDIQYTQQADLALQRAATSILDYRLIQTQGVAFGPFISPDNRYLRFGRLETEEVAGSVRLVTEMWDLMSMERLWQTGDYFVPGRESDLRDTSSEYGTVVAVPFDDSQLLLLSVETGEVVRTLEGNSAPIVFGQVSPDGTVLAAGARDGAIHVWSTETGEELQRFSVGEGPFAREGAQQLLVAVSPDSRLVAAHALGRTLVWEIETGREVFTFEHAREGYLLAPQFAAGGDLLLAARFPAVKLYDLTTGEEVEHNLPPSDVGLLSPDARIFAYGLEGDLEQYVVLREVASGRELHRLRGHKDGARPVAFMDDGRKLVTWGWEGTARVWDVETGQELLVLAGHTDAIEDAILSADERYLVTTGQDSTVRIWDLEMPHRGEFRLEGARRVFQVSPDGSLALTTDPESNMAVLLDPHSMQIRHQLGFQLDPLFDGSGARPPFSSDSQFVLGRDWSGKILVYEVSSGELIAELDNPQDTYKHPVFVPGGRHILAGGDRAAYFIDLETGEHLRVLDEPDDNLHPNPFVDLVAVSHDGRYAAMHEETSDFSHIVHLWDLETGQLEFQSTDQPTDWIVAFAFSRDGRYFAWGGTENLVYVLDRQTGEETMRLSHLDSVHQIEFAPDGQHMLVSTGGDGVYLWNYQTGEVVRRFHAGSGQAATVEFVQDAEYILYSTLENGYIYRQPVLVRGLIEQVCGILARDLTALERQTYELDESPTCPASDDT